jgi:hypothetical protein
MTLADLQAFRARQASERPPQQPHWSGMKLSTPQYEEAGRRAKKWRVDLDHCPLCHLDPDNLPMDPDDPRELCADGGCRNELKRLRDLVAAGIAPPMYEFDWEAATSTSITRTVNAFTGDDFRRYVSEGKGLAFLSPTPGAGKTTGVA